MTDLTIEDALSMLKKGVPLGNRYKELRAFLIRTLEEHARVISGVTLKWTAPSPPNAACYYHHTIAETQFGRFLLTWKDGKVDPEYGFDETPWDAVVYDGWATVAEAQEWAAMEMARRINAHITKEQK